MRSHEPELDPLLPIQSHASNGIDMTELVITYSTRVVNGHVYESLFYLLIYLLTSSAIFTINTIVIQ